MIDTIITVLNKYEEARSTMLATVKKELASSFDSILGLYGGLETISWIQYTMYYNDGDECPFCVNAYSTRINNTDDGDVEKSFLNAVRNKVIDLIKCIPADVMEDLFGDHVKVTYSKTDGFITEDFSDHA